MSTLYWKNVSTDQAWENVLNWFTDAAATTQASEVPWTQTGPYNGYNLTLATGETSSPIIDAPQANQVSIGHNFSITGTCDIVNVYFWGDSVYGGTWSGDHFWNYNNIRGGTFSGAHIYSCYVWGGTFSGSYFNNSGSVYGGTFTGAHFSNDASIYGGTFSGDSFINSQFIYGGTFSNAGFLNGYAIFGGTFSGSGFSSPYYNCYYYYGWDGTGYDSLGYNSSGVNSAGRHALFWRKTTSDWGNSWNNVANWFLDSNGAAPATSVPWTQNDAYKDYDLVLGGSENIGAYCVIGDSNNTSVKIGWDGVTGSSWTITGTCYLSGIVSYAKIYDGNICDLGGFDNEGGTIYGGTFQYLTTNYGYIVGGTFQAFSLYNNGNISGGTFTSTNMRNLGDISGGDFYGDGWYNESVISGGNFYGAGASFFNGDTNTIYVNGYDTGLTTGSDNTYWYIDGTLTTLSASGNGFYNGTIWSYGTDTSATTGWDGYNTYWIDGISTTLDSSGSGIYGGSMWSGGSLYGGTTGYCPGNNIYYIDGNATGLDSDGTGWYAAAGIYYTATVPTAWSTLTKTDSDISVVYTGNRVTFSYSGSSFSKVLPQLDPLLTGL